MKERTLPSRALWCAALCMGFAAERAAQSPGTVLSERKIAWSSGGFQGALDDNDQFGRATVSLGDLDGDGVGDLAVGAIGDDDAGTNAGAVWILFLAADGTVRSERKITAGLGGMVGPVNRFDRFGIALGTPGDLDGDGRSELVVGADRNDEGGADRGAVWVLFLDAGGGVRREVKIGDGLAGFSGVLTNGDQFGHAVAGVGDVDGDGVADLLVGADGDDDGGIDRGAAWLLMLDGTGTVRTNVKISSTTAGFTAALANGARFGSAVAGLGDHDDDGTPDVAVGAELDAGGAGPAGSVFVLFLAPDGSVQRLSEIGSASGIALGAFDRFGASLAMPGDLDGDGSGDLAIGSPGDDDGGSGRGAMWFAFLDSAGGARSFTKVSSTQGGFVGGLGNGDRFGNAVAAVGDLDGDGLSDLAVGADGDDEGGLDRGAAWLLYLDGVPATGANAEPRAACSAYVTLDGALPGEGRVLLMARVADADGDALACAWSVAGRPLASGSVQTIAGAEPIALSPLIHAPPGMTDLDLAAVTFDLRIDDGAGGIVDCAVVPLIVDSFAEVLPAPSDVRSIWTVASNDVSLAPLEP